MQKIRSIMYLLFLIHTYISVFSYNDMDLSFRGEEGSDKKITNLGGILGSYLSYVLLKFLGLTSIVAVTTIIYFALLPRRRRLLTIIYLVLVNLSICPVLERFSLSITAKFMHGGMLGYILNSNYPFYIFLVTLSIGISGLFGWGKTVRFVIFLFRIIPNIFFLRSHRRTLSKRSIVLSEIGRQCKSRFLIQKKSKERYKQKIKKGALQKCCSKFEFPSIHLLYKTKESLKVKELNEIESNKNLSSLEEALNDFGIQGKIVNIHHGPVVTLYKLQPKAGTKSSRVIGLADDIARSIGAISARISIIPGQNTIGIELPNKKRETISLRDLFESSEYLNTDLDLPIALGKEINGKSFVVDLAKMPHLLISGTTGSGKSIAINAMILSLVYQLNPNECKMIMIDPKMLELSIYDGIPYLITPVVTDPKKAIFTLKWVVREMENRYRMMSYLNVRNLINYNKKILEAKNSKIELKHVMQVGFNSTTGKPLFEKVPMKMETFPYIVIIIDEIADLMLLSGKEIESYIQRLSQMARAAGIHIIIATQRPSVDVITGVIKANFPTRISFAMSSKIDSRTILGEHGAEKLLGMGDMLYMSHGNRTTRIHGPFISDSEVQNIVDHLRMQGTPSYIEEIIREEKNLYPDSKIEKKENEIYNRAIALVQRDRKISTSYIQQQLKIGYSRALSIIKRMEREGIISAPNSYGKRKILKSFPCDNNTSTSFSSNIL